jgi:peptidyl-prolyl cis-trans isomerase SurA
MIKLFKLIILSLFIFIPIKAMDSSIKIRVNNQIITNIDIETEYRYLTALNNDLKKLDEATVKKIAKESIIREKIKKAELLKYYDLDEDTIYLDDVIKNFYTMLGLKDVVEFQNYLGNYNLELEVVKEKIKIEMLWNTLVGKKYKDQININKESLRKQIDKNFTSDLINEYELSEIVFQINDGENLEKKLNIIKISINEKGFNNTANIYSKSDSSKFGGNLGWVAEKNLSKNIVQIIKDLKIGEISEPIKIASGFLVLKIDNKKKETANIDKNELLEEAILSETNRQFTQFSVIYYNKINLNSLISEQ